MCPLSGSDSKLPTILYVISLSFSKSITVTVEPKTTRPVSGISFTSMTWAFAKAISISLIFASISPCNSFAAWYSAFSFKSPWALASAIAWEIWGLSTNFKCESFSLIKISPSLVSGTLDIVEL